MDHVEECPSYYVDCWGTICDCDYEHICMCRELRACEERVREDEQSHNFSPDIHWDGMAEAYQRGLDVGLLEGRTDPGISEKQAIANYAIYQNGYASALDAAREAVAALLAYYSPYGPLIRTMAALAAIDALRGGRRGE